MAENFDLLLLHGPPFAGRDLYIADYVNESHTEIIPRKIFQSNNDVGLRDIILKVVTLLKKKKKVVINDENSKKTTWESYANMVKRKVPSKSIAVMSVLPKHGLQQLYWSRQYHMLDSNDWELSHDNNLNRWFDNTGNISYHSVDEPVTMDGVDVFHKEYPLILKTNVQVNIPALFLPWDVVFSEMSIKAGIIKTCQLWSQKFQHGRIFILLDLNKRSLYVDSSFQEEITNCMKNLITKLADIPVYLYVTDKDAVSYGIPPNPGILATIQKSHNVDLYHKNTILLYQDPLYSKMAEMAGIQYVNASKVLQKPTLVLNKMIFSTPRPPEFLQDIKIIINEDGSNNLPLYDHKDSFHDNCINQEVSQGIQAYLYCSNMECLESYQKKYEDFMNDQYDISTQLQHVDTSHVSDNDEEVIFQNKSFTRELPKWMLGTSKSSSSLSSHRSDSVTSTTSTEGKVKSTVYVMTEQELMEVATEILKQAGREDILKRIEEQQISKSSSLLGKRKEDKTDVRSQTCLLNREEENTNESDPTCISASSRKKSNRKLDRKLHSASNKTEIRSRDLFDSFSMNRDNETGTYSKCNNRKVNSSDTRNIDTMEISPDSHLKPTKDVLDTFCDDTKQIDSGQDDIEMTSNLKNNISSKGDTTLTWSTRTCDSHALTRNKKRSCDKEDDLETVCKIAESDMSTYEPSLNIDPTKLFQDLPDSAGNKTPVKCKNLITDQTKYNSCSPKNTYGPLESVASISSCKRKKPDLSFLDDIFG